MLAEVCECFTGTIICNHLKRGRSPGTSGHMSISRARRLHCEKGSSANQLLQAWVIHAITQPEDAADDQAKHAHFSGCKGFRDQKIYLDDDLTKLQLEGCHSLAARMASVTGRGHRTWWRRDALCWADASGMHRQEPAAL